MVCRSDSIFLTMFISLFRMMIYCNSFVPSKVVLLLWLESSKRTADYGKQVFMTMCFVRKNQFLKLLPTFGKTLCVLDLSKTASTIPGLVRKFGTIGNIVTRVHKNSRVAADKLPPYGPGTRMRIFLSQSSELDKIR